MIHHHSSGKRRLWKRIFSMCIALILICGMTVPASSVSASQEMAGTVEEQTLKDESGQTTDVLSADSESSEQQQVSDSGSGTSEDQSEDENEDQILSDEQTDTDMTDETEETTTENSGDSNSTQPEETKPETPENGEQTGTEEDKGTDGALTEDETGEGDTVASDGTEADEGETEETVTYEQAARAALALYGEEAAFLNDEVVDSAYYEIVADGSEYVGEISGSFLTGEVSDATVPSISGYEFVNATVDGIEIESVGILTYEGTTYVYYTTDGSVSGIAAMVLGEGQKIQLNYETFRQDFSITYTVTGASDITAESVFGADRPTTAEEGDSYAFRATIPRGYTATVSVNGEKVGVLGTEPTYQRTDNVINTVGEPTELTLTGTYEITDVSGDQTVTVALTRRTAYTFSASEWVQTVYANGRAEFGKTSGSFQAESVDDVSVWQFTTNQAEFNSQDAVWVLDSLQINGTKLNIPYGDYTNGSDVISASTTLPSGTEVTIALIVNREQVRDGWFRWHYEYSRTYTVYVSNCYENITITGGNLYNSASWQEIVADRLVGVELQIYDRQNGENKWTYVEQSEPIGVGNNGNDKNYWFGDQMRFQLLPGYVNPRVTYGTENGIDENDLGSYLSGVTEGNDGWYYFSINSQGNNTFTMLRIEAEIGYYDVSYSKGIYDVQTSGDPTLPDYDDSNYNIVNNSQIVISSTVPVDATGKNEFTYWTLEGYEDQDGNLIPISPNDVLDLETVAEYAVEGENGQYILPLTANWVSSETAEQVTYSIVFALLDENGGITYQETQGTYRTPVGSTIILDTSSAEVEAFLEKYPGYAVDEERTQKVYTNISSGEQLFIYFSKATVDLKITKNVAGELGDTQKEFNFTYSYKPDSTSTPVEGKLTLKSGESETISDVPIGAELVLTETNADGYTTTAVYGNADINVSENNNSRTMSIIITEGTDEIIVTNTKAHTPDTGIHLTSWPYILTLTFVSAGAVTLGVYKCRKRHD